MSVDWKGLEDTLVKAIKDRRAKDEDAFAKLIADEYDRAVKHRASDLVLRNTALVTNKSNLENALKTAFKLAKAAQSNSNAQQVMRTFINMGVIGYWTGGKLSLTTPPPPAVSVVSNVVASPGVPPDVKISNASKPEDFAREFVAKVRAHALTITVITTGVTSNGTPVILTINGIN